MFVNYFIIFASFSGKWITCIRVKNGTLDANDGYVGLDLREGKQFTRVAVVISRRVK